MDLMKTVVTESLKKFTEEEQLKLAKILQGDLDLSKRVYVEEEHDLLIRFAFMVGTISTVSGMLIDILKNSGLYLEDKNDN